MKNMMKYFLLVAVAAMGFACSEDQSDSTVSIPEVEMVEMTVLADADSRTIYDEGTKKAQWESTGEYIQVWETIDGSEEPASKKSSQGEVDTEGKAAFKVSFTAHNTGTEYAYHAVYPASAVVTDNNLTVEKLKLITPAVQNATANSFDGAADLLISQPKILEAQPTELSLAFARMVAIGKMTLKGLPTAEKILSVSFSSEGKVFAGRSYFNANTAEAVQYGYYSPSAELTINYAEGLDNNVEAGTPIYFTSLPTEIKGGESFTVTVSTASKKFTRTVTLPEEASIAFNAGRVSTFGVKMDSATVEEISSLEGDYAVMAKSSDKIFKMGDKGSGNFLSSNEDATLTDIPEQYKYLDESLVWTVVAGENENEYYLQQKSSGKYVSWSSGNAATLATTAYALKIEKQEGGTYKVFSAATTARKLQYNAGDPRFAFYESTQTPIYLVPATPNTDPTLTVLAQPTMVAAAGAEVTVELFTVNLTEEIEVACKENWISDLAVADNKLTFTVGENTSEEERTTTITLSANGVEATVEVSQAGKAAESGPQWVRVTSLADITEGTYVIVATSSQTDYYCPNATFQSGTHPKAVTLSSKGVTVSGDLLVGEIVDDMKWVFSGVNTAMTITKFGAKTKLYTTNDNNGISVGTPSTSGSWKFTVKKSNFLATYTTSRCLGLYGTQDWRSYKSTNLGSYSNPEGEIRLYKLVEGTGGGETPEQPAEPVQLDAPENVTATASGKTVTVTWSEVENANSYTITCGDKTEDGIEGTSVEFEMDYDGSYTVTVVAKGDGTNYTDSPEVIINNVETEADPNAGGGGDEGGEPVMVTLTNAEIAAAKTSSTSYRTLTISSASGTWSGWGIVNKSGTTNFLQLNSPNTSSRKGCNIKSPEFAGVVSKIVVYTNNSTASGRMVYICAADYDSGQTSTSAPTGTNIKAQGKSSAANGTITISDIENLGLSQFKIFTNGALYIDHIEVTYK